MKLCVDRDGVRIWQGDARHVSESIGAETVDLIVTSPPYFGQRDYKDDDGSLEGQIGSEPTPQEFLDALVECTADWMRVLRPGGSIWVNLGDKYSQRTQTRRSSHQPGTHPDEFEEFAESWAERAAKGHVRMPNQNKVDGSLLGHIPEKSLMLLPERYRIRCVDELGLIARAVVIWDKPSGMPESVGDRVARKHEDWVHLVKERRYYADMNPLRESHSEVSVSRSKRNRFTVDASQDGVGTPHSLRPEKSVNPLGKLPGSVWRIDTAPFKAPVDLSIDHHAAFPPEWPRRIISAWCPVGGTVLDPFGGTGTVSMMARALGREAHHVDLSGAYVRLAEWRIFDSGHAERALAKAAARPAQTSKELRKVADAFGMAIEVVVERLAKSELELQLDALQAELEAA